MSGSFLFLAVALGADPAPPMTPPATPPPAVAAPAGPIHVTGTGCGGCGTPAVSYAACDPCAGRVGLFDRLRASWAGRPRLFGRNNNCAPACDPCATPAFIAPAPVVVAPAPAASCGCGQPVFTGFTTSCNDPCERVGLLARLRARFHGGKSCDACAAPLASACCGSSVAGMPGGCTSSYGTVVTPPATGGTTTPDKTPTPMPKGEEPKKEEPKKELSAQVPSVTVPSVEAPRVPTLGGTSGKY